MNTSKLEEWDVIAHVEETAKAWGYPKSKIKFVEGTGEDFAVAGKNMQTAGKCDLRTGNVTIYTESLTEGYDDPVELTAHEVMHGVYEHVSKRYAAEETKAFSLHGKTDDVLDENMMITAKYKDKFPVAYEMQGTFSAWGNSRYNERTGTDKFEKEDGVTDYSKKWWKENKAGNCGTHVAIHETLAEIAAHEARTGKIIGKPHYREAYKAVKSAWVASGGINGKSTEPSGPEPDMEFSDAEVFINRAFTVVPPEEAEMVVRWSKDGTITYGVLKPNVEKEEKAFDPSQPRNPDGTWGSGGSAPDRGDGSGAQGTSPVAEPGEAWKAQDGEWRSFISKAEKNANPDAKKAIKALKDAAPGTGVSPDDANDGSGALLAKEGKMFDATNVRMLPAKANSCHQNCAKLYGSAKFPKKAYGIATGYYMDSDEGLWRSHSWLFKRSSGQVIETTGNRATHYFGAELSDADAKTFTKNGGLLKDE